MDKKDIVVLGAGPSGLCAAWNLVKDGHNVIVLEKEASCGGQSVTFRRGDYSYDLGPHNIHSQRKSIVNFLKNNFKNSFIKHKFRSQIFFRNKRINYPFAGMDILKSVNPITAVSCALSFLHSRLVTFFIPSFKDDGSYRTWVINRFGRRFYDIYFGPYSKKVWGIPPEGLSDIVAKKRIAVSGIMELLHSVIFKTQRYHPENPGTIENYYHRSGIGAVCDFFVNDIARGGGRILTKSAVTKLIVSGNKIREVCYINDGKASSLKFDANKDCRILSTIPINEMVLILEGGIPENVRSAAEELDFTSEVFLYLNIKKPVVFNVPLLYFSEPEFPFNRIYDVGQFSREMVPSGKNALCLEISCNKDDGIWNMNDDALFDKCIGPLELHGLLKRPEVEGYHTRRMIHAYPRFRVGYEKRLSTIFNYISHIANLTSFGRQGLFAYANVDDAIWMGFEVAKNVCYDDRLRLSIKELLPHYITF